MKRWILTAAILGSVIVGCDKKDETPATPTTPKPTPTAADAAPAIPQVVTPTADATPPATPVVAQAPVVQTPVAQSPVVPTPAADSTPATPTTPPADAAQTALDASRASAVDAQTKAQSLMDQVMAALKNNKLGDAQSAMTKLQALEAKLPASWQAKIKSAQDALTATKAGDSLKSALPSFGK